VWKILFTQILEVLVYTSSNERL